MTILSGIVIGISIREMSFNAFCTIVLPALAALGAAFGGAKYAFELHVKKQEKELINRNLGSGNKAIFSLVMKYNKLTNFDAQILKHFEGSPKAFLEMPPVLDLTKNEVILDIDSISFLLETKYMNLLAEISIAVAKYDSAIDAINSRSRFHINIIQPALEEAGIIEHKNYNKDDIEKALGPRLYTTIIQSTQQVSDHTKETIIFLEQITNQLTNALKELFPGRNIISLGKQ